MNKKKLFDLYKQWVSENKPDLPKEASFRCYSNIFDTKFNISEHKPKKDRCNRCNHWENAQNLEDKSSPLFSKIKDLYDQHLVDKETARGLKNQDKEYFIKNKDNEIGKSLCVICFDYEKNLPLPKSETNAFYYKRKLNVNNFTIFDIGRKIGYCYCYDETDARKGANEVSSLLLSFMTDRIKEGITEFRMYSDNCSGQNRNRFVFGAYVLASLKFKNIKITHTFLECRHTQNEADSVHALIESK